VGDQGEALDPALRDQQAVERIAMVQRQIAYRNRVFQPKRE
jgi:hypothetical protein